MSEIGPEFLISVQTGYFSGFPEPCSQMKAGKALGPSGIVVEMIRAAGDMGASMTHDLAAAIIRDGKVPSDWDQSFIVCLYKGRGCIGKGQLPWSQADSRL